MIELVKLLKLPVLAGFQPPLVAGIEHFPDRAGNAVDGPPKLVQGVKEGFNVLGEVVRREVLCEFLQAHADSIDPLADLRARQKHVNRMRDGGR